MKVLKGLNLDDVVFIDIETIRGVDKLEKDTPLYDSWEYKFRYSGEAEKFGENKDSLEVLFEKKASLYPEFGKIVCITIGKISDNIIKLKSYYGDNEAEILQDFCNVTTNLQAKNKHLKFCGFSIIGFDIPFLLRRCLINGIEPPNIIDVAAEKPWTVAETLIDLAALWKGTGFYGASLLNIATCLGLPSPKSDINGSETSEVYYKESGGLERIVAYCERDVATTANIFRKLRFEEVLDVELSQINEEKVPLLTKAYNTKKLSTKDKILLEERLSGLNKEELKLAKDITACIK